ncbi:unnamed protein product [Ostreobium quekettii]|uniref:F-box/LRR-repeat protein 15-like leucin rich repeat domain-containing protein n=1 Tax=Ostreobium quekettii TaxID=121088 RepID=A0A8S1J9J3_9CHLO|nr:unnamed protein product [Ostreobium quekettii]
MDNGLRRSKRLKAGGVSWRCALPEVLRLVLAMVEEHKVNVFLKHARLVNRHWSAWATNATRHLGIGCGPDDCVKCNKLLKTFTRLEDVALIGVRDYDLLDIHRLQRVTHLKVEYDRHVIANMVHLPLVQVGALTTLVALELGSDAKLAYPRIPIEDKDVNMLVNLKRLTTLDLSHSQVTSKCVGALEQLPFLTNIDLSGCRFGDSDVQQLAGLTRISSVQLCECLLGDNGMKALSLMPNLTLLNIGRCPNISNEGVAHLGSLTKLTELHLPPQTCASGLQHLAALTPMSSLFLNHTETAVVHGIGDVGVAYLVQFRWLSRLVIGNDPLISDVGAILLGKLTGLVELGLHCTDGARDMVTDNGIFAFTALTALESLSLSGYYYITSAGLQHLSCLTKLRVLRLERLPCLYDNAMAGMTSLTLLVELSLHNCWNVTHEGVTKLEHLASLTKVDVAGCHRVSNATLKSLGKLRALTELDLTLRGWITNAGLMHLVPLPFLRHVNLHGRHVKKGRFEALKRKWEKMHS